MCLYTVLRLLLLTESLSNLRPSISRLYLESHYEGEGGRGEVTADIKLTVCIHIILWCTCTLTALEDMCSSLLGMSGLCLGLERGETSNISHAIPVHTEGKAAENYL